MTEVITKDQVLEAIEAIPLDDLATSQEDGFVAYSEGRAVVLPVSHLRLNEPRGDVHIKGGYVEGDGAECYVVKTASSFYGNPELGLPSSNGSMQLYNRRTGEPLALIDDGGYLTDVRTALAGLVVARHTAPSSVEAIGIVGTGTQARFQLPYLKDVLGCSRVYVWGRDDEKLSAYQAEMSELGFDVTITQDMDLLMASCNYVVTTTSADEPLIDASMVRPGTHITAMGADSPGKQELDPAILSLADMVVVDSVAQCSEYGELSHARGLVDPKKIMELGRLIVEGWERPEGAITVADLTGVGVQDYQIAVVVYKYVRASRSR